MLFRKILPVMICILFLFAFSGGLSGCSTDGKETDADAKGSSPVQTGLAETSTGSVSEGTAAGTENTTTGQSDAKPVFVDEKSRSYQETSYKPLKFDSKVRPYTVDSGLSNIVNLDQFGQFSAAQKAMLSKNCFFVSPSGEEQLFYIYEGNEYLKLPSFVSADSVLQVYHVFFDYSLRTLESQKLLGSLEQLTDHMLNKSVYLYDNLTDSRIKAEALKNIAYFAVAQTALKKALPPSVPDEAKALAEKEYALITAAKGFDKSPLFGFDLDYSQYRPRGHYTRSEDFERFFRAMMWYGQVPFNLLAEDGGGKAVIDREPAVRALLMTYGIFMGGNKEGKSDIELWEQIYAPTAFYVGCADDLTIYNYKDLFLKVYGKDPDLNGLLDEDKLAALTAEAKKLPEPQIRQAWVTVNTPVGKQFRFMGQRYIPDSEILQRLVDPDKRPMPSGLDVMGVLGSDRAYALLTGEYGVPNAWPKYPEVYKTVKEKFTKLPEAQWRSNMYYGWLWTLKSLLLPFDQGGYPSFMTNAAWKDKSLNTALGSWAELRHDTILYGKQSGAECGGDMPPPVIKSYVEPNVETYQKLLWLTRYSRENLTAMEILPEDLQNRMQTFEDLLDFLTKCSVKELKNEELTKEEYDTLLTYGGTLEYLTSAMAEEGMRWFEITSETDKNMANIADVHTNPGAYLEEGVGTAAQIFVVVPIGGKLYLTRGAVFNHYEFVSDTRLTDEEWQKMLKEGKQPEQPRWKDSFMEGPKDEIPVPKEPYNSGC